MSLLPLKSALQRLMREPAMLVTVQASQGSVPRGPGTAMLVWPDAECATIGGGHLEWQVLRHARLLLAGQDGPWQLRQVLGPSLGQCCGGVVTLGFERVRASDADRVRSLLKPPGQAVALFGGGHVGHAIVQVLAPLPVDVRWIDSRDGIFPADIPEDVQCEHSAPVEAAVGDLASGSHVLIMSFSHAEDLNIVMACLSRIRARDDLPFVGLIGSQTKWATFSHRLQARGFTAEELARVTCPIGLRGIRGKQPAVIALGVAAQLLQLMDKVLVRGD